MPNETINIPKEVQERIFEYSTKFLIPYREPIIKALPSEAIKAKGLLDALEEAKHTIEWMNNNMSVDDKNLQEHYGNLFMNTQHKIDDSINNYLNK